MNLNEKEQQLHAQNVRENQKAAAYLAKSLAQAEQGESLVNCFDSCVQAECDYGKPPQALINILDSVGPDNQDLILKSLHLGAREYQSRNGGELPRGDMINAALVTAEQQLFDSAQLNGTQVNSSGHESTFVQPAPAIVTISMTLANALPIVASLANPDRSDVVPIIYTRAISDTKYGQLHETKYLDGNGATQQYFDPIFQFSLEQDENNKKLYSIRASRTYKDGKELVADPEAQALPFLGGRVRVYVNGLVVASDTHLQHAKSTGKSTINTLQEHGVEFDGKEVQLSGTADLDNSTVQVTFTDELPSDTNVTVEVIADYERKKNGEYVLSAPSLDYRLIARSVFSYPIRAVYSATIDAVNQMQINLGLDPRAAVSAIVLSKLYLEQNIRLLKQAKRTAQGRNCITYIDFSRGSDVTVAFNSTAEQAKEITVGLTTATKKINGNLDFIPSGYDVYVSDMGAGIFEACSDDSGYESLGSAVGAQNQIVQIGRIKRRKVNIYYVPKEANLFSESGSSSEMLMISRSNEAVRNMFVGFTTKSPEVKERDNVDFEQGVNVHAKLAADLNPIPLLSKQSILISLDNIPQSITG